MHDHKAPQLIQIAPLEPQVAPVQRVDPRAEAARSPDEVPGRARCGIHHGEGGRCRSGQRPVLWQDYQRHETKQPEKTLEFLKRMEAEVGINPRITRACS